jgi:hypothetical protein
MELLLTEAASRLQVPEELLSGLAVEATADADRVAAFLETLFQIIKEENPGSDIIDGWRTMLPARFLRELAAALRLLEWERNQLVAPHMKLPQARDAIEKVFVDLSVITGRPDLSIQLTKVFAEFFAWNSREALGANVVLDKLNENDLADKIATFMWAHRHDLEARSDVEVAG